MLSFCAVRALEALRVSVPPLMFRPDWLLPPMPVKLTLLSTLLVVPAMVSEPPPPMLTLLVGAIWPALVFITTG